MSHKKPTIAERGAQLVVHESTCQLLAFGSLAPISLKSDDVSADPHGERLCQVVEQHAYRLLRHVRWHKLAVKHLNLFSEKTEVNAK